MHTTALRIMSTFNTEKGDVDGEAGTYLRDRETRPVRLKPFPFKRTHWPQILNNKLALQD